MDDEQELAEIEKRIDGAAQFVWDNRLLVLMLIAAGAVVLASVALRENLELRKALMTQAPRKEHPCNCEEKEDTSYVPKTKMHVRDEDGNVYITEVETPNDDVA